MRLLLYSHDGQGLGHVRRNLALADALVRTEPTATVLLVSSTDHIDGLVVPPRVDVLKLPGVRKVGRHYAARRLDVPVADVWRMREALIAAAATTFSPDVLVADKHPLGAHGELRTALSVVRAAGGRTILGLRDILDAPATVRAEWAADGVLEAIAAYDRVLVYGSRAVLEQATAYGMPPHVARLLDYVGYVVGTPAPGDGASLRHGADGRPTVLATAGGGSDGYAALSRFLDASEGARWHPVVVSGSDAGAEEQSRLRTRTEAMGGTYHRFVRNLPLHFRSTGALVCMGGYNTLAEAMRAAVPTVVVPRTRPRQEQLLRARAFEGLGLLRAVVPSQATPEVLSAAVEDALAVDRDRLQVTVAARLDLDGAQRTAARLRALATARTAVPEVAHVAV